MISHIFNNFYGNRFDIISIFIRQWWWSSFPICAFTDLPEVGASITSANVVCFTRSYIDRTISFSSRNLNNFYRSRKSGIIFQIITTLFILFSLANNRIGQKEEKRSLAFLAYTRLSIVHSCPIRN